MVDDQAPRRPLVPVLDPHRAAVDHDVAGVGAARHAHTSEWERDQLVLGNLRVAHEIEPADAEQADVSVVGDRQRDAVRARVAVRQDAVVVPLLDPQLRRRDTCPLVCADFARSPAGFCERAVLVEQGTGREALLLHTSRDYCRGTTVSRWCG